MFAKVRSGMLTQQQSNAILQGELQRLREKFASHNAHDLLENIRQEEARIDRVVAEVYALVAARGLQFELSDADRVRLQAKGLTIDEIDRIRPMADVFVKRGDLPPHKGKIDRLLSRHNIPPAPINHQQAATLYLRALSTALRESADNYEKGFIDDQWHLEAVARATCFTASEPQPTDKPQSKSQLTTKVGASPADAPSAEAGAQSASAIVSLSHYSQKFASERLKFNRWNAKSRTQAMKTFDLFASYLEYDDLAKVTQTTLAGFKDCLQEIPTHYGKSPQDKKLSLQELCEKGKQLSSGKRGLGADAINRHLSFLGQLLKYTRDQGEALPHAVNLGALRVLESNDPMDEWDPWSQEQLEKLFATPPYNGCESHNRRVKPGSKVFHDALYFAPMMAFYTGARREEICGAGIDDIYKDANSQTWAFHIRNNEFRKLKRPWCERHVPLHPELIRLGLIEYVSAVRKLGYKALFPDLAAPTGRRAMGEQLAKHWTKVETATFPEGKPDRLSFNSFRHSFNDNLKNHFSDEIRAGLMGHKQKGETRGRYGSRLTLTSNARVVSKLFAPTKNIVAHPLHLLPQVVAREPVCKPRRTRRAP